MRHYLATLHKKPEHHKKRFAMLVSGGFTLFIFAFWTLVNFGSSGTVAKESQELTASSLQGEVSPFESLRQGFDSATDGFKGSFDTLNNTLNTYGPVRSDN